MVLEHHPKIRFDKGSIQLAKPGLPNYKLNQTLKYD